MNCFVTWQKIKRQWLRWFCLYTMLIPFFSKLRYPYIWRVHPPLICWNGGFLKSKVSKLVKSLLSLPIKYLGYRKLFSAAITCKIIWDAVREKDPNVLSRCHTKKRMGARGHTWPPFGMSPTVQKRKKKKKRKKVVPLQLFCGLHIALSRCHTKKRTGAHGRARLLLVWHRL